MGVLQRLPRSSPESQGVSSGALADFLDSLQAQALDLHSFMLVRHGQVVAEGWWSPYAPAEPHVLFSLSKSFTSTAVGWAVEEGRLSVDDAVLSFFPEQAPANPSANLQAMRVRHLLTMSTGQEADPIGVGPRSELRDWAREFLRAPVPNAPGSTFLYNSGATYMLSAILAKLTGMSLLEYLRPRLLEPMGIQGATWETCPLGICTGGWGLSVRTEDIACFGQAYLQGGRWQGSQVVPAAWVNEATRAHIMQGPGTADWMQGYGYQFWRCQHGAYRGDGAFGQFCIVMPEQDAVLAITAGLLDMQAVLDLVWKHVLPAMGAACSPTDQAGERALAARTAGLTLPPVAGERINALARRIDGRTHSLATADGKTADVQLGFGETHATLTVRDPRGTHRVQCGYGVWQHGGTTLRGLGEEVIAASGAWVEEGVWVAKLCFYRTPYTVTVTCRFADNELSVHGQQNVGFGPLELLRLAGPMACTTSGK